MDLFLKENIKLCDENVSTDEKIEDGQKLTRELEPLANKIVLLPCCLHKDT